MRGSFRGMVSFRGMISGGVLAAVLVALLAAGCSSAATAPPQSTGQSCYAFGVRALEAAPPASPASAGAGAALATRIAATAAPARVRMPVTVIALHGVLATATMLLVLLAAIGVS